jgi:hypothetical protein
MMARKSKAIITQELIEWGFVSLGEKVKRDKIFVFLMLMTIVQVGCRTMNNTPRGNAPEDIRRIFIGIWEGEYMDHEANSLRTWIQNRSEDGTYTMIFYHHTKKGIYESVQKGKWWIDGNRFYEIAPDVMEEADVYEFEILNEDEIRFKSTVKDYEFIDRRIQDFHDATII